MSIPLTDKNRLDLNFPEIAVQLHPTLNGGITADKISFGSHTEYKWQCSKFPEHIWEAPVYNRASGRGCPYCTNRKIWSGNSLATLFPEIAAQWHPTKNGNTTPDKIIAGSEETHWFKCDKGHEWQARLYSRTRDKKGCPCCANKKVCPENCLATLFSEIAEQWHPTLNGDVTSDQIIAGSANPYWWQCPKGHEYEASPSSRTGRDKTNCPYCANKKVWSGNCLTTLFPEIASQWHPILNGNTTPDQVIAGCNKKYWFKCPKGHEYKTSLDNRTSNKSGCPICKESRGEKRIAEVLTKMNKKFKRQVKFNSCRFIKPLPFDFGVRENDKIVLIEYHGKQHYKPFSFGSKQPDAANECFRQVKRNDKEKRQWAKRNKIPLLVIPYRDFDLTEKRIEDFLIFYF